MATPQPMPMPAQCPACAGPLMVTCLQCAHCGTEVSGVFVAGRLVNAPEPHASVLELFLRVRGNAKEMERALGVSYPTVRARLDEAFAAIRQEPPAAGPAARGATSGTPPTEAGRDPAARARRDAVLDALERGEINAAEAATRLRALRSPAAGPRSER